MPIDYKPYIIQEGRGLRGPVIYWMSREQRLYDNKALLYAQSKAIETGMPLLVVFCLAPSFLGATLRQYDFMLRGLKEVDAKLYLLNIPFHLLMGDPADEIYKFVNLSHASMVVTDFDPLKIKRKWKAQAAAKLPDTAFIEIDSHNIVPARIVSQKQEFAAYTIRPKINRLLNDYLYELPAPVKMNYVIRRLAGRLRIIYKNETGELYVTDVNWDDIPVLQNVESSVAPVERFLPGEDNALDALDYFLRNKLSGYADKRNDPVLAWQSDLSPYLHFGQIAPLRVVLSAQMHDENLPSLEAFLEELVIRRELADNFCLYCEDYDSFGCAPEWARATLDLHRIDKREYLYCCDQLEMAETHDKLWNAAQMEMCVKGKMHGYMRMYWAKKIVEWSPSPEEAFTSAVYLNDKYSLDGRDPNGYAGIAWAICGLHDRAWQERPVFGKVRYMNYNGCARKFDVKAYIRKNSI
jgi:deoxyribodipyrimidine photo-lyase